MSNLSEIQLSKSALLHNLQALKGLLAPGTKSVAVVKSNAYGHGLAEVVQILDGHVDAFQVDDLEELRLVRSITKTPVWVLGYVPMNALPESIDLGAELSLYDLERAQALQRLVAKPVHVHLKIDALLGRQGVLPDELDAFLSGLRQLPLVNVVTAYAHFANIEDTTDLTHALAQAETFETCFAKVKAQYPNVQRHISATSGAMAYEGTQPNEWVRLGVGLYGMYPSAALQRSHERLALKPVMRWVSHLAQVKELPANHPIGYGLTYITPERMKVGVVPQGYGGGYDRGFSNVGRVLVGGKSCNVLGRVSMNMFVVDLRGVADAKPEDEVVLLGSQEGASVTAEEMASQIGTINYEVTTRISPLLPRVVSR